MCIEVVLKNDGGGSRIELLLPRSPALFPRREPNLCLVAAQALVLNHHRQASPPLEPCRKPLDTWSHLVRRSVEPPWQPDDDRCETFLVCGQTFNLRAGKRECVTVEPCGVEYRDRARQSARRVADGHTDSPLTDVQPDDSRHAV